MFNRFKTTDYFIENHDHSIDVVDQNNISILNWNIQKKNRNIEWSDEFRELLESNDPSIILLQECQFQEGLESLLHLEKYGFCFAPNFVDIFKQRHSGVLTASHSKYNIATVIKSYAMEPLIKVPKIFLSTTYDMHDSEKELLVLNIHAINFVGVWQFVSQVEQLEYAITDHNGPVILSGDFNTWNRSRTMLLNKILTSAGMVKVDFSANHKKHIKKFLFRNPLDHIYYRDLIIKDTKALKTRTSDHNPLLVSFIIDSPLD